MIKLPFASKVEKLVQLFELTCDNLGNMTTQFIISVQDHELHMYSAANSILNSSLLLSMLFYTSILDKYSKGGLFLANNRKQ